MKLVKSAAADQVQVYKLMVNKHEKGTPTKFSVTPSETVKQVLIYVAAFSYELTMEAVFSFEASVNF